MPKLSYQRRKRDPWDGWYKTSRWQKLRWSILVRDRFTCKTCRTIKADTSQLVCDHITSHKGNERLFWTGPFQTLCKQCHDSLKQRADKGNPSTPIGLDGWPIEGAG